MSNNQNKNSNTSIRQNADSQSGDHQGRSASADTDAISKELEASRAEVAELKSLVQQIIARDAQSHEGDTGAPQSIVAAQPPQNLSDYEKRRGDFRDAALRAERRAEEESERQRTDNERLQSGEVQFEVSMFGEPRMTRTVGASSEYEARAKYEKFFNIIGVVGGTQKIIIKPLGEPVAV